MRLLLLFAVVLAYLPISHAQAKLSHAGALLERLTNPPTGFRMVFQRRDARGNSGFYEIIGQSNLWKAKYAADLAHLDNPNVNVQGGSLPNRQWLIKGNKTNDWNNEHRKKLVKIHVPRNRLPHLPEWPTHEELAGVYFYAYTALSLGIAPVLPGTMELKGTNFSTFYEGAEHVGHFDIDTEGRLTSASMLILDRGNVNEFKIKYTFQADRFRGEFPSVIELYRGRKPNQRYEILKYEPRGWKLPDSAFDINGVGSELAF